MDSSNTSESPDDDTASRLASLPEAPSLINRQRVAQADWRGVEAFLRQLSSEVGGSSFGVCLLSDRGIRRYNKRFRRQDQATDVLAFSAGGRGKRRKEEQRYLGDILISVETARRNAPRYGLRLEEEIKILALHGLLHLLGFDHEDDGGRMAREEKLWCARLGLARGLTARAGKPLRPAIATKPNPSRDEPGSPAHSDALGWRKGAGAPAVIPPHDVNPSRDRKGAVLASRRRTN